MTRPRSAAQAVGAALGAMVGKGFETTGVLAHLLVDCRDLLGADSVALLARDVEGELSLLAATSHHAVEIEMLQMQRAEGPCIEAIATNAPVRVSGAAELAQRWESVGGAMVSAGVTSVHALPMRYAGAALGGLNVFWATPVPDAVDGDLAQVFADLASLVVVQSVGVPLEQMRARLHEVLTDREVVEQAKGVIAWTQGVDLGEAYEVLLRRSEASGTALGRAAADVVEGALRGGPHLEPPGPAA